MNATHDGSWIAASTEVPADLPPEIPAEGIGVIDAIGFFVLMTVAGWAIGKVLGDEFHILPTLAGRTEISDEEARALADAALDQLEGGETIDNMADLLAAVNGPTRVAYVFDDSRMQRLLKVIERPSSAYDPRQRKHLENTYGVLAHLAKVVEAPERLELLAHMVRRLPDHPRLSAYMILVAKSHPNSWNDVAHAIEHEATDDSVISRIVDEQAPRGQQFVASADDHYMTDMVRFKRLAEDRANGMGTIVDNELNAMIAHELMFLALADRVTRRFQWLPTEAASIEDLITPDHLDVLIDASMNGVQEAPGLLAQLALAWAKQDVRPDDIESVLDGLGDAASQHGSAADGLIGIFKGTELIHSLSPAQAKLRERAHATLIEASKANYEVVTRMATQHLPGNLASADRQSGRLDPLRRSQLEPVDEQDVATTVSQEGLGLL